MTSVDGPATRPEAQAEAHRRPEAADRPDAIGRPEGAGWVEAAGPDPRHGWPPPGSHPAYQVPEPDRFTRFVLRLHERSPRWAVPLAALGCVGLGVAYALLTDPTRAEPDAAPSCLLKLTTGLDCPGCGGTRALWYVLHGDLPAAARHHFLFVFALPFLAYLFVAWAGRQAFGWRLPQPQVSSKVIGGFLAAWMVFSVARNLPWAPFTSLYV